MIKIALIGLGKIARDQHVPAISASADFELAATIDPKAAAISGIPHFPDVAEMRAALPQVAAVAVCTPPQVRASVAAAALSGGFHVMLEKPPAATISQARALVRAAARAGVTLFAAWHSREAGGVVPARAWLAGKHIRSVNIRWREDVRQWHPGQAWIWQPGGLGVFDPGINALSILTELVPGGVSLDGAVLDVPSNCAAPIAARLELRTDGGAPVTADFDFRQTGQQTWAIAFETDAGTLLLEDGGGKLSLPDADPARFANSEYPALYSRFADLIERRESSTDLAPFELVADAFLLGDWREVEPFYE